MTPSVLQPWNPKRSHKTRAAGWASRCTTMIPLKHGSQIFNLFGANVADHEHKGFLWGPRAEHLPNRYIGQTVPGHRPTPLLVVTRKTHQQDVPHFDRLFLLIFTDRSVLVAKDSSPPQTRPFGSVKHHQANILIHPTVFQLQGVKRITRDSRHILPKIELEGNHPSSLWTWKEKILCADTHNPPDPFPPTAFSTEELALSDAQIVARLSAFLPWADRLRQDVERLNDNAPDWLVTHGPTSSTLPGWSQRLPVTPTEVRQEAMIKASTVLAQALGWSQDASFSVQFSGWNPTKHRLKTPDRIHNPPPLTFLSHQRKTAASFHFHAAKDKAVLTLWSMMLDREGWPQWDQNTNGHRTQVETSPQKPAHERFALVRKHQDLVNTVLANAPP